MKKRILNEKDFIHLFNDLDIEESYFKEVYLYSPKFYERESIVNESYRFDLRIRILGLNEGMEIIEIALLFKNVINFSHNNEYDFEIVTYSINENKIDISFNGGINKIKSDKLFYSKKEISDLDSKITKWGNDKSNTW